MRSSDSCPDFRSTNRQVQGTINVSQCQTRDQEGSNRNCHGYHISGMHMNTATAQFEKRGRAGRSHGSNRGT